MFSKIDGYFWEESVRTAGDCPLSDRHRKRSVFFQPSSPSPASLRAPPPIRWYDLMNVQWSPTRPFNTNSTLTTAATLILWTGGGGGCGGADAPRVETSPFTRYHSSGLEPFFFSSMSSRKLSSLWQFHWSPSPPPRYYQTLQLVLSVVAESQSSSVNVWMVSGLKLRDVAAESDVLRAERATPELFNIYY